MADPDHIPTMDTLDRWSACLYRTGLSLIALGFAFTAWLEVAAPSAPVLGWLLVAVGVTLATANLHLYAKAFRWVFQMATGAALSLLLIATIALPRNDLLLCAGLALLCVPACGFALKEQFCFRLPGMRLLPLLLAVAVPPGLAGWPAALALSGATLLYGYLAIAKWRMPLHYDIGDKSKYQV
jgi:uncharacterized integral membrane protein